MAVLFDLDGTILSTREQKIDVMKRCTDKIGVRSLSREEYLQVFRRVIESGKIESREPVFEEIYGDKEVAKELADMYQEESLKNTRVQSDAGEVLQSLEAKKGLVTNGPRKTQWEKIGRFDLGKYFDSVVISGEVGIAKPDPRIYQRALDELGSKASGSCYVGDAEDPDGVGARRADLKSVLVKRGESRGSSKADYVVSDLRELFDILES